MIVTFYSFIMATIMGSILILIYTILKGRLIFILNFGPGTLIFCAALCFLRLILPFEMPEYQHIITIKLDNISDFWFTFLCRLVIILIAIIIIGFIFLGIKMIYYQIRLYRYLDSAPSTENYIAEELLITIDTTHTIKLRQISGISVPMVAGLFKPVIYLPDITYTEHQLRYILLHEYTHWKNKDLWVKFIIYIIMILFWWNPFVHLLVRNLDETLELKCDYIATHNFDDDERILYLETLLYSLKNQDVHLTLFNCILSSELINISNKTFIKQRFQFILSARPITFTYRGLQVLLLITALLFMLSSYLLIIQPGFEAPYNELWTEGVDFVANGKNSYIEKTKDGDYYFHTAGHIHGMCTKIPEEDMRKGYYDIYSIRSTNETDQKCISSLSQ